MKSYIVCDFFSHNNGETVWNVENKICGATDIELTQKGHEQAEETGRIILTMGIKADVILTSPLVRASETARHISEITGIPMKLEQRFIEQNSHRLGLRTVKLRNMSLFRSNYAGCNFDLPKGFTGNRIPSESVR